MMQALRHLRVFGMVVCAACGVTPELNEQTCTDGVDNDGDGAMDCAEASCQEIVCCDFANPFVASDPAEDAVHGYREPLMVRMDNDGPTAVSLLLDGEAVSVDVDRGGATRWIYPRDPLQPERSYELVVTSGCESTMVRFSTSAVGSESDPVDSGHVFLDLGEARWLEPAGVGSLLGKATAGGLSVSFDRESAVVVGADASSEPDRCQSGVDLARVETDRAFAAYSGAGEIWVETSQGFPARALVPTLEVTAHDGEVHAAFEAYLDVTSVEDIGFGDDVDWCGVDLGYDCVPCPDGSGTNCVPVRTDRIPAAAPLGEDQPPLGQCESTDCTEHPACD